MLSWTDEARPCGRVAAAGAAFLVALLLYSWTAAPTITSRNGGSDGGELASTAVSGGVPHPSGYPTYMLLARLALLLPAGEAAGKLAQLSALGGATAVALTALLVGSATGGVMHPPSWLVGSLYGGLTLMLSARLWSQATLTEVYTVFLVFVCLSVWAGAVWFHTSQNRWLNLSALIVGLGLGTHLTILAVAPGILAGSLMVPGRPRLVPRTGALVLSSGLAGSLIYCLLPVWAQRAVVPSWGDTGTLAGLWRHISGAEYRYLVGIVPWSQRANRLLFGLRDLLTQPGLVSIMLAVGWGIPFGWHKARPLLALTATIAVVHLLFAISYGAADGTVYLLPWTWVWCLWAGVGAVLALEQLGDMTRSASWQTIGIGILAATLIGPLVVQYPEHDLHADTTERDRTTAHLEALPPDAVLYTAEDAATFDAWYVQTTLHVRPDVQVIDTRLLAQPWYQEQLHRRLGVARDIKICEELIKRGRPAFAVVAQSREQVSILPPSACPS